MGFFKPNIEKMEAKGDVGGLIKALENEDDNFRFEVAKALIRIGKPVVEPLIQAFRYGNKHVQGAAWVVLEKIGEPAVESLTQVLKDENWLVRCMAAKALGEIGDARAVGPLIQALKDEDELVREAAEEALKKIKKKGS